ncbi:FMRFamide receptor-like [Physella acuta]|uniref:FMRFamide receptor-like n=1 Tax=Physella acuta TaxID=109671 RepID=UPI0027DBB898|nr:FMRFamide receptor-like [Physella acuta]
MVTHRDELPDEWNSFGNSDFYNEVYCKWLNWIFNFSIPFALLLFLNTCVIRMMRLNLSEAASMEIRLKNEHRLTIMVVCMTVLFFLCKLLEAVTTILEAWKTSYGELSKDAQRFTACADLFSIVNSAINFFIYYVTGRKFRAIFCRLFCTCRRGHCLPATLEGNLFRRVQFQTIRRNVKPFCRRMNPTEFCSSSGDMPSRSL